MKDNHTYREKMARNGRTKDIYKGTFICIQTLFQISVPETAILCNEIYKTTLSWVCWTLDHCPHMCRFRFGCCIIPAGSVFRSLQVCVTSRTTLWRTLKHIYCKIACSNMSRLEAHVGLFRLLMKGIFSPYVLWPFDKKLIF